MRVSVLGAGSWGSALAIAFAKAYSVKLYSRSKEQVKLMNELRANPDYLPKEIIFPTNLIVCEDINEALDTDLLIIATPLNAIRGLIRSLNIPVDKFPDTILVSKGFEAGTGCLPHQIMEQELPGFSNYGLLIGPSFAKEVALSLPTAVTLVSPKLEFAMKWMRNLSQVPNFRIYAHDDVIGSEAGAAIKNVLAIAVGISDGLNLGYNARAALMTRSLRELSSLILALGGRQETIYGLTGIGDLILTCTGDLSRNRKVGQELALGKNIDTIVEELGHVAEGVLTAKEIFLQSKALGIDMPIVSCVYNVIFNNSDIKQEIASLMSRTLRQEF